MAARTSKITLEVLLNEKDVTKQLISIFAGSSKGADALAKAILPVEKAVGKVVTRQQAVNKALKEGLALTQQIAANYESVAGRGGVQAGVRIAGAGGRRRGGRAGGGDEEEDPTVKLRREVQAYINIAKSQTEGSPESLRQLVRLQQELTDLTEDQSTELVRQGKYADLLVRAQRQLNAEAAKGASKGNQYTQQASRIATYGRQVRNSPGSDGAAVSVQAYRELQAEVLKLNELIDGLAIGTAEYDAALRNLNAANSILDSRAVKAIEDRISGRVDEIAIIKQEIATSAAGGKEGAEAFLRLKQLREDYQLQLAKEKGIHAAIGNELQQGVSDEVKRKELIEEQNASLRRQAELQKKSNAIMAASVRGTGRAAQQRRRRTEGYDTYSTLVDVGRIAQDAPYGIEGIANNIGPLIESFSGLYERVKLANNGVGTLRKTLAALARDAIFSPVGLILMINALIIIARYLPDVIKGVAEMSKKIEDSIDIVKRFKKEIAEAAATTLGQIVSDQDTASTRENIGSLITELQRLKQARFEAMTGGNPDELGAFDLLIGNTYIKIANAAAQLGEVFGGAKSDATAFQERIDLLSGAIDKGSEVLIEAEATVRAYREALNTGELDEYTRRLQTNMADIQKATLTAALAGAQTVREKVRITTALFQLETREQKRQIQIQLRNTIDQARAMRQAFEVTLELARAASAGVFNPTPAERARFTAAAGALRSQAALVEALVEQSRQFDAARDGALDNQIETLERTDDKAQNLLERLDDIRREALQKTQRLLDEIYKLRNENENNLESEQFARERRSAELEFIQAERQREQDLQDFRDTVEKLAEKGRLIAEFEARQNELRVEQREQVAVRLAQIALDEANYELEQRQRVRQEELTFGDLEDRRDFMGDELENAQANNEYLRQRLELNNQIAQLENIPEADRTAVQIRLIELFKNERDVLADIYEIESERRRERQERARIEARETSQAGVSSSEYDLRRARAERIRNTDDREVEIRGIELEEELEEMQREERSERRRIAELTSEKEQKDALVDLEQQMLNRRTAAWERYAEDLKNIQYELLNEQQRAIVDVASEMISSIDQISQASYNNWEQSTRARLALEGNTEEEITEAIKTQGAKRRKIMNTIAKAQIVASTAVAAMDAFEGTMKHSKYLGPAALPLALASAGLAIAFGKTQYDAVGRDNISSAGASGSNSFTVGTESAPGVQPYDAFTTDDPFFTGTRVQETVVSSGMAEMSEQLDALGSRVMESALVIASRPAIIGYTERAAADFVRRAGSYEEFVSR